MNVAVIGSGAIGLTIALRLAQQGVKVRVIDQGALARKSSWAGAGILPPANDKDPVHAIDHLQSLSNRLHPQLSEELLELTGIDNEYQVCGGINIATTVGESAALMGQANLWEKQQVQYQTLSSAELFEWEPGLNRDELRIRKAIRVPTESQLRNPRHLKALLKACEKLGVKLTPKTQVTKVTPKTSHVEIDVENERLCFDCVCLATGAWSTPLLKDISTLQVIPIKGHMLLYKLDQPLFRHVINEGNRYIVSRMDGHVLVGSSEEETGFDESTSAEEIDRLKSFASSMSRKLVDDQLVDIWTGLRPMAYDHLPYVGKHSRFPNVFVATGHFRSGLHLSPATAEVVCQLVLGQQPGFDISALRPER